MVSNSVPTARNRPVEVSICIPTFNGAMYLDAALRTARNQTLPAAEILVVDDGSTDRTLKTVQTHADADPRIRVVSNDTRLGLVGNWNRCTELARHDWVKFLFQDDLLDERCLERMVEGMRSHSALLGFVGRKVITSRHPTDRELAIATEIHGSNLACVMSEPGFLSADAVADHMLSGLTTNFFGEPSSAMFHRKLLYRYGAFDEGFRQLADLDFWLRAGTAEGAWFDPEALSMFRIHPTSTSFHQHDDRRGTVLTDAIRLETKVMTHPAYETVRLRADRQHVDVAPALRRHLHRLRLTSGPASLVDLEYLQAATARRPDLSHPTVLERLYERARMSRLRAVVVRLEGLARSLSRRKRPIRASGTRRRGSLT